MPFKIGFSPVTMVVGFFVVCIYGLAVGLTIEVSIFLQTPETTGGYGFTPKQNAECGYLPPRIHHGSTTDLAPFSRLCPMDRPHYMSNMRRLPQRQDSFMDLSSQRRRLASRVPPVPNPNSRSRLSHRVRNLRSRRPVRPIPTAARRPPSPKTPRANPHAKIPSPLHGPRPGHLPRHLRRLLQHPRLHDLHHRNLPRLPPPSRRHHERLPPNPRHRPPLLHPPLANRRHRRLVRVTFPPPPPLTHDQTLTERYRLFGTMAFLCLLATSLLTLLIRKGPALRRRGWDIAATEDGVRIIAAGEASFAS